MPTVEVRTINRKGEHKTFWRAGVQFGPEWAPFDLTEEQLKAVKAEPMLEVREAKGSIGGKDNENAATSSKDKEKSGSRAKSK